ncbi:MAG TPA: creatininase family protein [Gammaproteobacteria bacterium]|nr:creatininase family protein [Gammaproteobacteria bacterium]
MSKLRKVITIVILGSNFLYAGGSVLAQPTSVMIDDLTTTEVQAAIDGGKTTAIYYVGGTHQSGPAVVLGKHNLLASLLARRVAESLGNALAYPANPYAPAGDPIEKTGHMRFAGTVSLSHETLAAVSRDVAVSALAVGFTDVVMLGDHGETQEVIREVAAALDAEWRSMGGRVFFIPVYQEGEDKMREILAALDVPSNRTTPIDDASEMMALDSGNRWVRPEQLEDDIAAVASAELGRQFIAGKVEVAVTLIRELVQ